MIAPSEIKDTAEISPLKEPRVHQSKHWRARNLRQRLRQSKGAHEDEIYRLRKRPKSGYYAGLTGREAYE